MRKIVLLLQISFFLFSCSPKYNVEFKEYKSLRPEWLKKGILEDYKAEENKYSILYFTDGFEGEKALVMNKLDTLYNTTLKSGKSLGLAEILRINNTVFLKVVIDGTKLKLKRKDVSTYKFIYIGKNFNSEYLYTITYSNTPRTFR